MAAPSLRTMPSVRTMRKKGFQKHATRHDGQNKRVKWGTFCFRAHFAPFCARLARFRARFAQDPLIISGAKCQHHACQSRPNARRHSSSSKRQPDRVSQSSRSNFVMHSHATGRLLLPWGVSTYSPMHQALVRRAMSYPWAGLQTFHSERKISDFYPGGGIRCNHLKNKSCIQSCLETRTSSISCTAALLFDWSKSW